MVQDISEQVKKILDEPVGTPTEQEARDALISCGVLTEDGKIAPAYKDIATFHDKTQEDKNMTTEEFIARCRREVFDVATNDLNVNAFPSEVQLVWYSKTLQNYKCIMCIPGYQNVYECTYNGDKEEFYIDAYEKVLNKALPLVDKNEPRYKRIGQRIVDLGENRDRLYPYMVTPTNPFKGASNDIADLLDKFLIHVTAPNESAVLCTTRDEFQKAFESYKNNPDVMVSGVVVDHDRNECAVVAKMKNGEWELV